jgi:hypothetical protein
MVKGYCVVCKEKGVNMKDAKISQTVKGGYMAKGLCSKCNKTKMCAMMSKDNAEKAIAAGEATKDF